MGPAPTVTRDPDVIGLGEHLGCFDTDCARTVVAVAVFGSPSLTGDHLAPTVIRFCRMHQHDAWTLSHSWDDDAHAFAVEDWDRPGGVREYLFPEGLDEAATTRRYVS